MKTGIIAAFAVALITAGSTWAGDNNQLVIKGKVLDEKGKPEPDAEIRVKRLDQKGPEAVVSTDSRGKYIVTGLVVGNYSITAYDAHGFMRSRATIKTSRKGWANVNFDLSLDAGFEGGRISGHESFTQPNSHGGIISATQ